MYLTTNLILIYYHFTRVRTITLIQIVHMMYLYMSIRIPNRDCAHHTSSSQDEDTAGSYSDQRRTHIQANSRIATSE